MKNIVLKTTLITLASILALLILVLGILTLCFPKTLVSVTSDLGMRSVSTWYSERAYEKSKDEKDLQDLLFRTNANKDYERTVKYTPVFLVTDTFKNLNINDQNYLAGQYAVALYNVKTESSQIFVLIDAYNGDGYHTNNPYEYLVYSFDKKESTYDANFLTALKGHLEQKRNTLTGDNLTRVNENILVIEKLLKG